MSYSEFPTSRYTPDCNFRSTDFVNLRDSSVFKSFIHSLGEYQLSECRVDNKEVWFSLFRVDVTNKDGVANLPNKIRVVITDDSQDLESDDKLQEVSIRQDLKDALDELGGFIYEPKTSNENAFLSVINKAQVSLTIYPEKEDNQSLAMLSMRGQFTEVFRVGK
jgi:hypothetical protein